MEITLKDKNGVTLHTAKKYCEEDISVKVNTEELSITPSAEEQVQEGLFNKVTVSGDENLIAENIKKGVRIFDVEGGFDAVDTRDATATSNDIVEGTTAYVNNQKINGNVPNNGELEYNPSDEEQIIPSGLTSGGIVKATDITKLSEYEACLTLANSIDNLENYTDATATAEDILEGKVAYANGERLVGRMEMNDNNAKISGNLSNGMNGSYKYSNVYKLIVAIPKDMNIAPNSTSTVNMFYGCSKLEYIPILDMSKITDASQMFYGCTNLSDESLNNILIMCANADTKTKTLAYIGLTSVQATICTTLSNYQAFLDAGWTTGY